MAEKLEWVPVRYGLPIDGVFVLVTSKIGERWFPRMGCWELYRDGHVCKDLWGNEIEEPIFWAKVPNPV